MLEGEGVATAPEQEEEATPSPEAEKPEGATDQRKAADDRVRELQRRKDREVAEARKEAREASTRANELEGELREVRSLLAEVRQHSNISDDEAARIEQLAKKERTLSEREERARSYERTVAIRALSQEYGVPQEDLEAYDDPRDMKIAALEWRVSNGSRSSSAQTTSTDDAQPESTRPLLSEKKDEPPPRSSGFDTGSGALSPKTVSDMSDKEFAALRARNKAEARRRATQHS